MLIHTTYYKCPLCGEIVIKPITVRAKDSMPINNLVLRIKARVFKQDGGAPGEFKSIEPPRELAAEYGWLFFLGCYMEFVIVAFSVFPPSLSASHDDGSSIQPYLVFLVFLNAAVLWNMVFSSYNSKWLVAGVSLLAGLALVVLMGMAIGGSADYDNLLGKGMSLPIMQAVFLLWGFTYLIRAAELDKLD